MPSLKLSLEPGTKERVEVKWRGLWKDVHVLFDGRELGSFADKKALKAGGSFSLADGSTLTVRLSNRLGASGLEVLRNGTPLPGSAADPAQRLQVAYGIIFFIAGANFVLGVLAMVTRSSVLSQIGAVPGMVVQGLVYGALGLWLMKGRSYVALSLAVVLFILDGIVLALHGGSTGIIMRIFLLLPMLGGFGALKKLRASPS